MSLGSFGNFSSFVKFSIFSAIGGITTYYLVNAKTKNQVSEKDVIIITGCDSGLGYSIASHCHGELKMSVIACVKDENSQGSQKLKILFKNSGYSCIRQLDVTDQCSVDNLVIAIEEILKLDENFRLYGIVNNAGVMTFGEVEWQTNEMIESQLNVNLYGTIRVSKSFLPLARKYGSRFINVTSHCALHTLPTLSIYSATKAGIKAFTSGLRLEMNKYGVNVVNFIPGKFWKSSNLMSQQTEHFSEMRKNLSNEQLKFYGDYFERFSNILSYISGEKEIQMVDTVVVNKFDEALLDSPPEPVYLWQPLRYLVYHKLFNMAPQGISDWLTLKFLDLPEYDSSKASKYVQN